MSSGSQDVAAHHRESDELAPEILDFRSTAAIPSIEIAATGKLEVVNVIIMKIEIMIMH